ncbi:MAG: REP-associated tyrosine transposase [Acidobacteriaceae bacterium]
MPKIKSPVYGKGHLHFIACDCYRRRPKLGVEKHRDVFVRLLEEVRVKFRFTIAAYIVMPTHVHLLMTEPSIDTVANSVDMLQQRYRRRYNNSARSDAQVWETRYADVHIFGAERTAARIASMHREPIKAGLVEQAIDWEWSSARAYAGLAEGVVTIEQAAQSPILTKSDG